jgi:hypothetical protein
MNVEKPENVKKRFKSPTIFHSYKKKKKFIGLFKMIIYLCSPNKKQIQIQINT